MTAVFTNLTAILQDFHRPKFGTRNTIGGPEKAEIEIQEADHLYREVRVENEVGEDKGEKASLKPGAEVDVVIEADPDATLNKPE